MFNYGAIVALCINFTFQANKEPFQYTSRDMIVATNAAKTCAMRYKGCLKKLIRIEDLNYHAICK